MTHASNLHALPLIFSDAEQEIFVLNRTGANTTGSFVEQQLALIVNVPQDEDSFKVIYRKVKKQDEGTHQCGPLAIAYATELVFTNQVSFVDFALSVISSFAQMPP